MEVTTRKLSSFNVITKLQEGSQDIFWMMEVNERATYYQSCDVDGIKQELLTLMRSPNFNKVLTYLSPSFVDLFILHGQSCEIIMMGDVVNVPLYVRLVFPNEKIADLIHRDMHEYLQTNSLKLFGSE